MKFVPNLIPQKSKVLPEYFKGNIYETSEKSSLRDLLLWLLGIFFFIGALANITHPLLFLVFAILGTILIPPGHNFLEKTLKFKLTNKIRTFTAFALFIGAIPLTSRYIEVDKQDLQKEKINEIKIANEIVIEDEKEQQREDSLTYYLTKSNQLGKAHKLKEASIQLNLALSFANTESEKEQIEIEKINIETIKADDLVKAGKYKIALTKIDSLLYSDASNEDLVLNRAICYSKTGKTLEAVNDLKFLIQKGNPEAEKLHEKINPIRKKVAYYVTRCCDGTTSNAKGRGACSHHGGVCNWNEPVYEEYRKYE